MTVTDAHGSGRARLLLAGGIVVLDSECRDVGVCMGGGGRPVDAWYFKLRRSSEYSLVRAANGPVAVFFIKQAAVSHGHAPGGDQAHAYV